MALQLPALLRITRTEEKAAEKGTEPPAGKTEEKTFSQAAMEKSLSKLTETFKGSLQAAVEWKNDEACQ